MHDAEEPEVDEQLVDRRVARPLADAEPGPVDPVDAGLDGGQRVGERQPSVGVAVPVDLDVGAGEDVVAHEANQGLHAARRRVSDRVAKADAGGPALDGSAQ